MTAPAASLFRTCGVTGRRIHIQAEWLVKANAVVAVVALLVGATAALLLALTRWQAVHLLPPEWDYRLLGIHGMNMLIFFIIYFEMAVLWFAGTVLLNARPAAPKLGWMNFGLMTVGTLLVEWAQWTGRADVLFTSYPPLKAHPLFYVGLILFAVGALLVVSQFFATILIAKREKSYAGSMPLVVYGAVTAAIIAVITLLHGALIYIPTFLWSLGLIPSVDPQIYRMIWWGLGHSSQQINVAAMVAIWYLLGALTVGATVLNEKVSRSAFVLYILFISLASAHHLLVDPGFGPAWKIVNTSYFMYLAVLASMVHGFTVPAGMELGMRLRGFSQGLFGWLRRAPWGDPGFSALVLSIVVFGFFGGITGVTIGTEQINIIAHNTLRDPAQGPPFPVRPRLAAARVRDDLRRQLGGAAPPLGHFVLPGAVRRAVQSGRGPVPRHGGNRRHPGGNRRAGVHPDRREVGVLRRAGDRVPARCQFPGNSPGTHQPAGVSRERR